MRFAGYTELRELGRGATGRVIVARHDADGSLVAIKELSAEMLGDAAFVSRFRAEAEILRGLRHPNIVALYWYVEQPDGAAIAMEAVDGVALRRLLDSGPTEPEAALLTLRGSLLALDHAHRAGVVHRDYKPENVLVDATGASRLIDFGIAVPRGESGWRAGTPSYMAPEQWAAGEATPATDIYAVTATFFECLAGRPPYAAESLDRLRSQHEHAPIPLDDVPSAVRGLVRQGMAKRPEERQQAAGDYLRDLEAAAVEGYGQDWQERGRRSLAASALALAGLFPLALLGQSGAAMGGTTMATTDLGATGGAARATAPAGGGLHPRRPRPRMGTLGAAAVAAGLAIAGLVIATVVSHLRGSSSGPTALVGSLAADAVSPSGIDPAGFSPPGSPSVAASTYTRTSSGDVVQSLVLTEPLTMQLTFGYCDALSCGTSENIDCVGNLYIPQFSPLLSLSVPPLPGARARHVLVSAGPAPGATALVGYDDLAGIHTVDSSLLAAPPAVAADGTLTFTFASPLRAEFLAHTRSNGQVCGFSADQLKAFRAAHGAAYDGGVAIIDMVIVWSPPSTTAPATQAVVLDGSDQKQAITYTAAPATAPPHAATAFRQDDSRWASTAEGTSTFAAVGTVPTAVAAALSALGVTADPPTVGHDLAAAGAWKPGQGTVWSALVSYLGSKNVTVAESTLQAAVQGGGVFLVAESVSSGDVSRETVLAVTGYEAATDTFSVIDPTSGATSRSFDSLAGGNPWVLQLSPAATGT